MLPSGCGLQQALGGASPSRSGRLGLMRWPSLGPARTPCATVFFAQSGGAVPSIRWAQAAGGQRAYLVRLEYAQQRLRPVPVVPDAFLDRLAAQADQS